jgi:transforming growth factor-beta-induced protein
MSISSWKFNTTNNDTFFWQALSETGEILGRSSQDFKSQSGARYNADLVGRNGEFSKQLIWDFTQDSQNDWSWKAHNLINKENVATAHKTFDTKSDAIKNAMLFGYDGELVSSVSSGYSGNNAHSFAATEPVTVHATTVTSEATSYTNSDSTHTNQNFTGSSTVQTKDNTNKGFGIWSWLKWLILALLLIALLWWLVPWLLNQFKGNTNTTTSTSVTTPVVNKPTGLLAALPSTNYNLLTSNIQSAGLLEVVNKSAPVTLLAPTNSAFEALSPDALANLKKPENLSKYQDVLKNHLFAGNIDLSTLKDGSTIKSLAGYDLPVKIDMGKLYIAGVEVDKGVDGNANGVSVYSVPKLLEIPTTTTPASVTTTTTTTPAVSTISYKAGNSLDAANKAGNFKTLLAAVNAAGLKDTLEGDGPFTIFAPNDEVFAKIKPTVDDLLKPENKTKLQAFLKNHVAAGKYTSADFIANKTVTTLGGQTVTLNATGPNNTGKIVSTKSTSSAPTPDIITTNGVVHVLTDNVIL